MIRVLISSLFHVQSNACDFYYNPPTCSKCWTNVSTKLRRDEDSRITYKIEQYRYLTCFIPKTHQNNNKLMPPVIKHTKLSEQRDLDV